MKLGFDTFVFMAISGILLELIILFIVHRVTTTLIKKRALNKLISQNYVYVIGDTRLDFAKERAEIEAEKNKPKEKKSLFFVPFKKKKEVKKDPDRTEAEEIKENIKYKKINAFADTKTMLHTSAGVGSVTAPVDNQQPIKENIQETPENNPNSIKHSDDTGFILVSSEEKKEGEPNGKPSS